MENEENNFDGSMYDESARLAWRSFKATLDYYERDGGYESGDEFDIADNNVNNLKGDEG